jgi:hypothetical protein
MLHAWRTGDDKFTHILVRIFWKRSLEIPEHGWEDNIRKDMKDSL